jgi:hypothetical protein
MDIESDSLLSLQSESSYHLPVLGDYYRIIPSTEPTYENGKVLYTCKYYNYNKTNTITVPLSGDFKE